MDDNNDFKKLKKHENRVYNIVKLSISEGADFCLNTLPPSSQTGRYAKVILHSLQICMPEMIFTFIVFVYIY